MNLMRSRGLLFYARVMASDQTSVLLRWAEPRDAEAITEYHHRCWQQAFAPIVSAEVMATVSPNLDRWQGWLNDGEAYRTIVAVNEDDKAIGHATVQADELVHLYVNPDHHGAGLGRQMLAVAERLIRRAGFEQAKLRTIVGNVPAIGLYESQGWVMTDEIIPDVRANGSSFDEHVLRKDLVGPASHVAANRDHWNNNAYEWVDRGRRSWASAPHWGEMHIPESETGLLVDIGGRDVVELGCGTGYVSAWCLAAGAASAVGVDNSIEQLRSARMLQTEFDRLFPLLRANAETLPLPDDAFDFAISEYGSALWCDPYAWIPEAARVLRPGGRLVFLSWSTMMAMAAPDFDAQHTSTSLLRPQRDLHQVLFPDFDGVEFALSHGRWIDLLLANGFRIDRLVELHAPDAGPDRYSFYDAAWARQWPAEEAWVATYEPD